MGFGREVFYRMYDQQARWNYDGSPKSASDGKMYSIKASSTSYSASSIKGVISKAKPGDVLQMNKPKMHTMIFVSSDADGFTVYDANWTAANTVSVRYVKYGAWASRNTGCCMRPIIRKTNSNRTCHRHRLRSVPIFLAPSNVHTRYIFGIVYKVCEEWYTNNRRVGFISRVNAP